MTPPSQEQSTSNLSGKKFSNLAGLSKSLLEALEEQEEYELKALESWDEQKILLAFEEAE